MIFYEARKIKSPRWSPQQNNNVDIYMRLANAAPNVGIHVK